MSTKPLAADTQVGFGWQVDILVITRSGVKIVVEVDGPTHFARSWDIDFAGGSQTQPKLLGSTCIRDKSMRRLGFRVVALSFASLHWNIKESVVSQLQEALAVEE